METQDLEVASLLKFSDIPIPAKFKFSPKGSFAFHNENFRVALLRYTGKATPQQVISFYQDQMGLYNWNLINIVEYDIRVLNFEKQNETCVVTISPRKNNVNLVISVAPRALSPGAKRTKQELLK